MARFRFRLQPVLDHRERIEDERAIALAAARAAEREAEAARDDFILRRDTLREEIRSGHRALDGDRLRAGYAHLEWLDREILAAQERVEACAAESERERVRLVAASRDRRVMETLRERRREAHREEEGRVANRELDDLNARAHERAISPQGAQP